MKSRHITLVICLLFAALAFADDPALIAGKITVFGSKITVSPPVVEIPAGVPIFISTTGSGLTGKLVGELRGPSLTSAVTFETTPGQPFQLPALNTKGTYYFEDIRLVNGDQILASATPDHVEIHVIELLISEISSRPLSLNEIRSLGIVINESDFSASSFEVGLTFNGQQIKVAFPLLIPKRPGLQPLIPPSVRNAGFTGHHFSGGPSVSSIPNIQPVMMGPTSAELDGGLLPDIPGVIIFPNEIAFLNQFFAVVLMVRNAASEGTGLSVEDLHAQVVVDPKELKLAKTNPAVPLGTPVPVRLPGADGQIGTADDLELIVAQQTAKAEFFVEGLSEGTHVVRINLNGMLHGLVQGDIPISGAATGAVLVRNPNFAITFSHPSVVRAFEEYDLFITITNTSQVDANLVRLSIPSSAISNAVIVGSSSVDFETIKPGESATGKFRVQPQVTGMVTSAVLTGDGNIKGQFQFRIGVGEKGIPLSPNTLILPEYANALGTDFVQNGLNVLGLAYSAATAPPGGLPPGVPPIGKNIVFQRAVEMAQAGQRFTLYPDRNETLSQLLLDWLGNEVADANFDSLRRTTEKGRNFFDEVFSEISTDHALEFHDTFAGQTSYRQPYLSALLTAASNPATLELKIKDSSDNTVAGSGGEFGPLTNLPYADLLQNSDRSIQWALVGNVSSSPLYTVEISGQGSGVLSLIVPMGSDFYKTEVNLAVDTGNIYTAQIDLQHPSSILEFHDRSGNVISSQLQLISGFPLQVLGAVQDAKADKTGHVLAVLFNRPLSQQQAEDLDNYSIAGRHPVDAKLQNGGRIVYLAFLNPISPLISNDLTLSGLNTDDAGWQQTIRILTTVTTEAGRVTGRFLGSDGTPIPGATIHLSETDHDDLFGELVAHVTAVATTDAQGEFSFEYVRKGQAFVIQGQDPLTGDTGDSSSSITQPNQLIQLDIILLGRGSISGQVFEIQPDGSRKLLTNMLVKAISLIEAVAPRSVATDASGHYRIDRLAVGTVNLTAQNRNVAELPTRFGAVSVAIPSAGSVVSADIQVLANNGTGRVSGRVLQFDAQTPIEDAYLTLTVKLSNGFGFNMAAFTDEQGWFHFDPVPSGNVTLAALDPATGRSIGIVNLTLYPDDDATVNIVAKGNGNIKAYITPASGMQLSDIAVYVYNTSFIQDPLSSNVAEFDGLPVGSWSVTAVHKPTGTRIYAGATILYASQTVNVSLIFPERGTITGIIRTADNQGPAARAAVLLFNGPALRRVTTAGNDGSYSFQDEPFGGYAVHAIAENQNDGGSTPVNISNTNRVGTADVTFLGKGTVTVSVSTANGPVVVPVTLNTVDFDVDGRIAYLISYTQKTKTDGTTVFTDIFRRPFSVDVNSGLTASAHVPGNLTGPATTVEIVLDSLPSITGVVHSPDAGPVQGASVNVQNTSLTATTDIDGSFTIHDVPGKSATLIASGTVTVDGISMSSKGMATTGVPQNNPVDIHLLGFGKVNVTAEDANGNFVPNASLKLIVPGLLAQTLTATADANGQHLFTLVPEGPFSIEASNSEIGGRTGAEAVNAGTVNVTVTLAAVGTVQGTVFKSDASTRVPTAEVTLVEPFELGPQVIGTTTADGNGNFVFRNVSVGSTHPRQYTVAALDKNTGRRAESSTFTVAGNAVVVQNLILEGEGKVKGTVFDYTGRNTIAAAEVRLVSHGVVRRTLVTTTDENGSFTLNNVPQGDYTITATSGDLVGQVTSSIDFDGQQIQNSILLEPCVEISGIIQYANGSPVESDFNTTLRLTSAQIVDRSIDVAAGKFQVGGLPLGTYRMTVNYIGYRGLLMATFTQPGPQSVVLKLKGHHTLNVTLAGAPADPTTSVTLALQNEFGTPKITNALPYEITTSFLNVEEGNYTLTAKTTALKGSAAGTIAVDSPATIDVTLVMSASGTVTGTVYRPDGTTRASAVGVQVAGNQYSLFDETNQDGNFAIDGVPAGSYTVTAFDYSGSGKARESGSLADGEVRSHTLTLDAVRPTVAAVSPAANSTGSSRNSTITVVFSEPMDDASAAGAFSLTSSAGKTAGSLMLSGSVLTFTPTASLAANTTYSIVTDASAEDVAGNTMAADFVASFTTLDDVAPTVTNTLPIDKAYNVPLNTSITLFFNEPIADRGAYTLTHTAAGLVNVASETWNAARTQMTLQLIGLQENDTVTFSIVGFKDGAGNVQTTAKTITFDAIDTQPPAAPVLSAPAEIREGTSVNVDATAESLSNVDFYLKGSLKYHDTTVPYRYTVPKTLTTIAANGSDQLVIEATATDRSGNISLPSSVTVKLNPDTPPKFNSVSTNPPEGPVFPGTSIRVDYDVTDDGSITKVQVIVTGALTQTIDAGTSRTGHQTINLPSNLVPGSSLFVSVRATDDAGHSTTSPAKTFTIVQDTTAPSVVITAPAGGQLTITEGQSFTVAATVTDNVAVSHVMFSFDGIDFEDMSSPYTTSFTAPAVEQDTTISGAVTGYDTATPTNATSVSYTVLVKPVFDPDLPTIEFVCPTMNAFFPANSTLDLKVHLTDNNNVNRVEFYRENETTPFGSLDNLASKDTTANAQDMLGALTAGTHVNYRAVVYDYSGKSASATAMIEIVDGTHITQDTTILSNNTSYDNKTIIVDPGVTLTIDGLHTFVDVVVMNGANITQIDTTTATEYKLNFNATRVYVACGGKLDVVGSGYSSTRTYPNASEGATTTFSSAGGHGGLGGRSGSETLEVSYGSYVNPQESGSGGGGTGGINGGGVIVIEAGSLQVDGAITADGADFVSGAGAGGSVLISTGEISGSGVVSANGGAGNRSGGGGRVAVYYMQDAMAGSVRSHVQARAGNADSSSVDDTGGTGTVYLFDRSSTASSTYGNLVLDNTGVSYPTASQPTVIPSAGSGTTGTFGTISADKALLSGSVHEVVVSEDSILEGATTSRDSNDNWNWVSEPVYSGTRAHQSQNSSGSHQHRFENFRTWVMAPGGAKFVQWVYIPSNSVPAEIMLVWQDATGGTEHRAYWGANSITSGTNNTASRWPMGPLPTQRDQWIKLEVPASVVGLEGKVIQGWRYTLYDGSIVWDHSAIETNQYPYGLEGLYLRVHGSGGDHDFRIAGNTGTGAYSAGLVLDVSGVSDLSSYQNKLYETVLKTDSLDLRGGAWLQFDGTVEQQGSLSLDGGASGNTVVLDAALVVKGDLTLHDGVVLAQKGTTDEAEYKARLNVIGKLTIDGTSRIDASGSGYSSTRTYPNVSEGATTSFSSAGGHGGLGGRSSSETLEVSYGSYVNPQESGSGGGGSGGINGGGVIVIEAGSLQVDGAITADGADFVSGAGAGGSVLITTGEISGSGVVSANGGAGNRSGGGGRVAVYYTQDAMAGSVRSHVQARAGNADSSSVDDTGGAGTVYLFDRSSIASSTYGNLVLDNTGVSYPTASQPTAIPSAGSGTSGTFGTAISGKAMLSGSVHEVVVSEDTIPEGATTSNTSDSGWTWVSEPVYSGMRAHQSQNVSGSHQHNFEDFRTWMMAPVGAKFVQYVYIPSATAPQTIMMTWQDASGSVEHRAYWGANLFTGGTNGTASRYPMGALPSQRDQWVRLEVPASVVGLEGKVIKGWRYILYNGSITWDHSTIETDQYPYGLEGLYLRVHGSNGDHDFPIAGNGGSGAYSAGMRLDISGVSDLTSFEHRPYETVLKTDSLDIRAGAWLQFDGTVEQEGNLTLDGGLSGNTVLIDAPFKVNGDLTLINTTLTHQDTNLDQEYRLELEVTGTLTIDSTSKIDVSGRGYDGARTYLNTSVGATTGTSSGGSHAGLGGKSGTQTVGSTYGSFVDPIEPGAGGGSSTRSGGGVVLIQSGSLLLNGSIVADGSPVPAGNSNGAGAGGSIRIATGQISGSGAITANGGSGPRSGGGGRVAISYTFDSMTGGLSSKVQTRGGNGDTNAANAAGGAGTIYLYRSDGGSTFGELIVSNFGVGFTQNSQNTTVSTIGSGSVTLLQQDSMDPSVWSIRTSVSSGFPHSVEGGSIVFHGAYGDSPRYYILGRSPQDHRTLYFFATSGQASPSAVGVTVNDTYSGVYQLDSLTVKGGAKLVFTDPLSCPIRSVEAGSTLQATIVP